ncbi:meiotically up-regulated gene 65 protein [Histoplasma capsulatum G186AR]|uniref:Meiotically up-regulated gene 65 protein n=2 Tax=Ajellomyces capsulatus TaxID=5037 RepID=C0NGL2_AJECG|nr:meiotically up-regulated gene 65 protein [Histoplasma capsulatum G186AR]EEH08947.1 meiotically up-regulated gene 65 protein [Histoplasma capsulatum G186AR]KAG5303735.1 meiotically up-regulated gene 65 protein [Histoplasma capsulatum]QSS69331.1 meiotically up-regulated gene 65 protein [Histoplasma capsulatum G186AR]
MSTIPGISLVDKTSPTTPVEPVSTTNEDLEQRLSVGSRTATALTKKLTKSSMKDSLARRKYAKFQQCRYRNGNSNDSIDSNRASLSRQGSADIGIERQGSRDNTKQLGKQALSKGASDGSSELAPSASHSSQPPLTSENSEIDVLYENQRGWWCFGIPIYSAKSLLNFDPSAWLSRNFAASPVDITNAQVPDPSWEWAWETWYIDMSYDVDEAGWQYSFSFSSRFAWHGTHPWYHCFVRRRRWLRKRVRKIYIGPEEDVCLGKTSTLNGDYFTVSSCRTLKADPESRRVSRVTISTVGVRVEDILPEDITTIRTLLCAMTGASLDRDKILAVQRFVKYADEEFHLLPEKMSEILSVLMFHTSRQQLLDYLRYTMETIPATAEGVQKRRRDSLAKIFEDGRLKDLNFWLNSKVLVREEGHGSDVGEGSEPAHQSINKSKGKAVVRSVVDMEQTSD